MADALPNDAEIEEALEEVVPPLPTKGMAADPKKALKDSAPLMVALLHQNLNRLVRWSRNPKHDAHFRMVCASEASRILIKTLGFTVAQQVKHQHVTGQDALPRYDALPMDQRKAFEAWLDQAEALGIDVAALIQGAPKELGP